MSISLLTHNQRGMALLNLVFLFIFLGVLVASGLQMYGSIVTRGLINDTKSGLENQVKMIVTWAEKSGRLPTTAEYPGVFGVAAPLDAWGKPVVYLYDANLTATATGGLCGRTNSTIKYSGVDVAFILISGGEDRIVDSTPATIDPLSVNYPVLFPSDLYRVVPLEELKSKAGCYGPTGGRLRIVNNELPKACAGSATYPATLFANGGVPTYIGGVPTYNWSLLPQSSSPWNAILVGSATGVLSLPIGTRITTTPGSYAVTAQLVDSTNTSVQRAYSIKVSILGSCSAACAADPACSTACKADPACKAACAADPACAAACPACTAVPVPAITFTNPPTNTVSDNWNGGVVTDTGLHSQGSKIDFILDPTIGTMSAISGQNGTSTNCIWYQNPLTLTGKKLRAYFNFSIHPNQNEGFVFVLMPAQGRHIATKSCNSNANDDVNKQHDSMGFGPGIPGYGSTLIGVEFPAFDFSTCISTDGVQCNGTDNSWLNNSSAYNVRIELDATVSPYILKEWLCPVGAGSCSAANIAALKDLSAPIPTPYSVTLTPYVTATLTQPQIDALSQFFIGFTTSQQGNDQISLVLSGLEFGLY